MSNGRIFAGVGIAAVFIVAIVFFVDFSAIVSDREIITNEKSSEKIQNQISSITSLNPFRDETLPELYEYALKSVNKDRRVYGLSPVWLGDNSAAQDHADDMFDKNYFSHWNSKGVKPYVTYTELGGNGTVKENIAFAWCEGVGCSMNAKEQIDAAQHNMVYEDENAMWGHRDTILDPYATNVNFGIAYDDNRFYFVQQFETKLIDWEILEVNDGILRMKGNIQPGYSLNHFTIYKDDEPKLLSTIELENQSPYNLGNYEAGEFAGMLLEKPRPPLMYPECAPGKIENYDGKGNYYCVDYVFIENSSKEHLDFEVDVSKWLDQEGLYTLYIMIEDPYGYYFSTTSITLNYL